MASRHLHKTRRETHDRGLREANVVSHFFQHLVDSLSPPNLEVQLSPLLTRSEVLPPTFHYRGSLTLNEI